jgi:hypothetical protein
MAADRTEFAPEPFNLAAHTWLDASDPPHPLEQGPRAPALGYHPAARAIAAAIEEAPASHEATPYGTVIGVAGNDGWETVHLIPPGIVVSRVIRHLQQEPEVAAVRMMGLLPPEANPDTGLLEGESYGQTPPPPPGSDAFRRAMREEMRRLSAPSPYDQDDSNDSWSEVGDRVTAYEDRLRAVERRRRRNLLEARVRAQEAARIRMDQEAREHAASQQAATERPWARLRAWFRRLW